MSANLQHCASNPGAPLPKLAAKTGKTIPRRQVTGSTLTRHRPTRQRFAQQLIWVLISLLILLYLAASYVYWAKTRSAWPL